MAERILEKLKRIKNPSYNDEAILELIKLAETRILLRAGIFLDDGDVFPDELEYIVIDITLSMLNIMESDLEGIDNESVDTWRIQVISDLLKPYEKELINFRSHYKDGKGTIEKVRFI